VIKSLASPTLNIINISMAPLKKLPARFMYKI
jgi:hypothetical protein